MRLWLSMRFSSSSILARSWSFSSFNRSPASSAPSASSSLSESDALWASSFMSSMAFCRSSSLVSEFSPEVSALISTQVSDVESCGAQAVMPSKAVAARMAAAVFFKGSPKSSANTQDTLLSAGRERDNHAAAPVTRRGEITAALRTHEAHDPLAAAARAQGRSHTVARGKPADSWRLELALTEKSIEVR